MNLLKSFGSWLPSSSKAEEKKEELPSDLAVESPDGVEESKEAPDQRSSLWKVLSSKMGMDVAVGVSLPVWFFEPITVLQKMSEMLHFADLLNEAADLDNPLDRLAYVAVFVATGYNGSERYAKPFNPVLGETFEMVDERTGVHYFAEQVCHHPPVAACRATTNKFEYWQESGLKTKFNGNSIDIDTQGKTHIYFPRTKDHFVLTNPTTRVNNLLIGRIWIDHFGELSIKNIKTGDTCTAMFERCGYFGKGRHEVSGIVKNAKGEECLRVHGKWSGSLNVKWIHSKGKEPAGTQRCLWTRPTNNSFGKYKYTEYAMKLNDMDSRHELILPTTDSRVRPDRRALDNGDLSEAGASKSRIEEKQRSDRRQRAATSEEWTPRWFKQIPEEDGKSTIWVYSGEYWEAREKKGQVVDSILEKRGLSPSSEIPQEDIKAVLAEIEDTLSVGVQGSACDFRAYE